MPHFIIECADSLLDDVSPNDLFNAIYTAACDSQLFDPNDIKSRLVPYQHHQAGTGTVSFIHVSGHILSGRTTEQKQQLSQRLLDKLSVTLPKAQSVTVQITDIDRDTYSKVTR